MTFAKGLALALGFAGAVVLGVLIGPHITNRGVPTDDATVSATQPQAADVHKVDKEEMAREGQRAPASRAGAKRTRTAASIKATTPGATPLSVPAAAPALHERLKPLLNKGVDMGRAAEDFRDGEQFAAVAHAARNTDAPFMVLKHRVVEEGKSLETAINEVKPDLNAADEARRARAQAKSDISALTG